MHKKGGNKVRKNSRRLSVIQMRASREEMYGDFNEGKGVTLSPGGDHFLRPIVEENGTAAIRVVSNH